MKKTRLTKSNPFKNFILTPILIIIYIGMFYLTYLCIRDYYGYTNLFWGIKYLVYAFWLLNILHLIGFLLAKFQVFRQKFWEHITNPYTYFRELPSDFGVGVTSILFDSTIENNKDIIVNVPGSKSITNRALMLAALSDGECNLDGVLFSDDSRAFLDCLEKLGFQLFIDENEKRVKVVGTSGEIPNRKATIDVRSAGTAARFLTVMLAVTGGEYTLNSSEQMKKRPMGEIIDLIRSAGVKISCLEEEGHFPFIISSNGLDKKEVSINTDTSSQYASALLMAAVMKIGRVSCRERV